MIKGLEKKLGACYNEFYSWSYCSQDKSWYEDGVEELPLPKTKTDTSRFDFVPLVGAFADPEAISHERREIKEYVNYLFDKNPDNLDSPGCCLQVHFISDKRRTSGCFPEESVCEIDKMIKELKRKDNIFYYIEPYCCLKFISWKISKKMTRFAVFDYSEGSDRYLQCVFDITAPKDLIISRLEGVVETWKDMVLERIRYMEEIKGKKFINLKKDSTIEYFFPEFNVDSNELKDCLIDN